MKNNGPNGTGSIFANEGSVQKVSQNFVVQSKISEISDKDFPKQLFFVKFLFNLGVKHTFNMTF